MLNVCKKKINENIKTQNIIWYSKPIIRQRKDARKQKREEERKERRKNEAEGRRKGGETTGQTNTAVGSRVSRRPRCHGNPGYL